MAKKGIAPVKQAPTPVPHKPQPNRQEPVTRVSDGKHPDHRM